MQTTNAFEAPFSTLAQQLLNVRTTWDQVQAMVKEGNDTISAQIGALRAENERRAKAGVKVSLSGDDFDARYIRALLGVIEALNRRAETIASLYKTAASTAEGGLMLAAEMGKQIRHLEAQAIAASEPTPQGPIHGLDPYVHSAGSRYER